MQAEIMVGNVRFALNNSYQILLCIGTNLTLCLYIGKEKELKAKQNPAWGSFYEIEREVWAGLGRLGSLEFLDFFYFYKDTTLGSIQFRFIKETKLIL